jgi:hypothetical protein
VALSVGPFAEELRLGNFADWLARLQEQSVKLVYVDRPLARRRLLLDNLGRREADQRKDYLEVIRPKMARRGEQQT